MARIRTIKPELPHSETLALVSRDARLLFILLFTIADDEGRARASSRLLASLLYPHDDGMEGHIRTNSTDVGCWLAELAAVGAVELYKGDDTEYLHIAKWLVHQNIDRPSKSRLPEPSRTLANPREPSMQDLGPRIMDLVSPKEGEVAKNGSLRSLNNKPDAQDGWTPEQKKMAWQGKICKWAQRELPDKKYAEFVVAWTAGEKWATDLAEKFDAAIKAAAKRRA